MRFCCWECGWCWCWRQKVDVDFSVKPRVSVGGGTDDGNKDQWPKKIRGFGDALKKWFEFDRDMSFDDDDLMFSLLLALYSHDMLSIEGIQEESLIADEMNTIFDNDPSVIDFYLPQLCTYLAMTGFSPHLSPSVMSFLFESVCRRDVRLAHKVMWHFNAFCSLPNMNGAVQSMNECIEREGTIAIRETQRQLTLDSFTFPASNTSQRNCLIKDDNKTTKSSVETVGHENIEDFEIYGYKELFYSCINFMESLTNLSATLTEIEPSNREGYMRDALERINEVFLGKESAGSELVYIPLGQCFCRVISIIPSESCLLPTKQRVPLFLTLEVESFELNQLGLGIRSAGKVKDRRFNRKLSDFGQNLFRQFNSMGLHERAPPSRHVSEEMMSASESSNCLSPQHVRLGQWADPLHTTLPVREEKTERRTKLGSKGWFSRFKIWKSEYSNLNSNAGVSATFVDNQETGTRRGNEYGETKDSPLLLTPTVSIDIDQIRQKEENITCCSPERDNLTSFLSEEMEKDILKDENNQHDEEQVDEALSNNKASIGATDQEFILFKERWSEKEARIWQERQQHQQSTLCENTDDDESRHHERRTTSMSHEFGHGTLFPGRVRSNCGGCSWSLVPIIVKANDDLRQDQAVSQLIALLDRVWKSAKIGVYVYPYSVLATSQTAGIIEAIPDTLPLHALKSHTRGTPLDVFFTQHFSKKKGGVKRARSNFIKSCAGYAIVCYLLQVKDRHNGNILLGTEGHLIHIDWGFVLGLSPGGNFGFESAPFKLTTEMVSIMGGDHSFAYQRFCSLCIEAFLEARQRREKLILLVQLLAENRELPCFSRCDPKNIVESLRDRFLPNKTPSDCADIINGMISASKASWRTRVYDSYQRYASGVM